MLSLMVYLHLAAGLPNSLAKLAANLALDGTRILHRQNSQKHVELATRPIPQVRPSL